MKESIVLDNLDSLRDAMDAETTRLADLVLSETRALADAIANADEVEGAEQRIENLNAIAERMKLIGKSPEQPIPDPEPLPNPSE